MAWIIAAVAVAWAVNAEHRVQLRDGQVDVLRAALSRLWGKYLAELGGREPTSLETFIAQSKED